MPRPLPLDKAKELIIENFQAWERRGFDPEWEKYYIIPISEYLYCIPTIHSGYASKWASELPLSELTKDHYFSRARTAYRILDLMRKGILTPNRMEAFLKSRSRVHYVTKSENMKLSTRGKTAPHWKQMYAQAGIELIPYKGKSRKQ